MSFGGGVEFGSWLGAARAMPSKSTTARQHMLSLPGKLEVIAKHLFILAHFGTVKKDAVLGFREPPAHSHIPRQAVLLGQAGEGESHHLQHHHGTTTTAIAFG